MKKYFSGLFLAALTVVAFTACSDDDDDYQWATVSGQQVYFSNALASKIELSMKESSFTIPINRVDDASAITVPLKHTDATGFYSIPSEVSFAAGQKVADIKVTYKNDAMEYDKFIKDTLSIPTEFTTPYGYSTYAFQAGASSPYESLGTGTLSDAFLGIKGQKVTIMQNTEKTNIFRIYGGWDSVDDGNQDEYLEIRIMKPGDTVGDVTITKNDLVIWEADFNTGYHHPTYGADVLVCHPYGFSSTKTEDFWLHNCVLEYQEDGLPGEIQLAPFYYMNGVGGWNYSQNDGMIDIVFPGFYKKDLSLEVETLGVLTDFEGTASVAINAQLGADATDVRGIVVSEDADLEAIAAAVASDEIETTPIIPGYNFVPIPENMTGKLTIYVMVFDEGNLKGESASEFEYWGGGVNPWVDQAVGDFIYTLLFTNDDGSPYNDEGLTMQYNADDDAYRINHWGYDVDFSFKWNKESNAVSVPAQYTGATGGDGDIFVAESDDYANAVGGWEEGEENDGPSYFDPETLTFHFQLAYYVKAGCYAHGEETYKLTPAEARALGLAKTAMPSFKSNLKATKKSHKKAQFGIWK